MRPVYVVGTAQLPVRKRYERTLRQLGAEVVTTALADAGVERPDALYVSNMLSDELQGQKHLAALVADEAGLAGVEAIQIRAATAAGAAALRIGFLAVASGAVDVAVVAGVEKMSDQAPTPALAKALDAEREVPDGATLLSQNARLMQEYIERYRVPPDSFANFAVNAHANARGNPYALFNDDEVSAVDVLASRFVFWPLRLYDCSPICDGAAAVVLAPSHRGQAKNPVRLLASSAATDRFRIADRPDPLRLDAATLAFRQALAQAGITQEQIDFYEVHDAFSIMACMLLEALGLAEPGAGWRLAASGAIRRDGPYPISTLGGLKARGHPIGATALYQACEIVQQLTGCAGVGQLARARIGLLQSVGGAGTTVLSHIFGARE